MPVGKVIDWERNPLSSADPNLPALLARNTYMPVSESETYFNVFGQGVFRSVGNAAHAYPHPDTLYKTKQETVPFQVVAHWDVGVPDTEGVYQAVLFLRTDGDFQKDVWEVDIDIGDNVYRWGWSDNGFVATFPNDQMVLFTSAGAWNPTLTNEFKSIYIFALEGDPETLAVGGAYETVLVAPIPEITLALKAGGGLHLDWTDSSAAYQIQGRASLTTGDWETAANIYGASEAIIPTDSPRAFFRVKALH